VHEKFNFNLLEEIREKTKALGLSLEFSEDLSPLRKEVRIRRKTAPNSFAVLPMEGCDSNPDGSPSELVKRRYARLAAGAYGLIWWEANAIMQEARANELQMMLTGQNLPQFAALVAETKTLCKNNFGYEPVYVLQLTHSGRYSRPEGHKPHPLIPQHDPILDPRTGVNTGTVPISDEYLESLVPVYIASARLAREAGFDGVDIKACHRYLLSELLASHTREGKYGGSYENRTRLLLNIIKEVRKACGDDFIVACRFNVFDAHPYPYGFGQDKDGFLTFDPVEPERLVRDLCAAGVDLLSNSAGNPYYIYPQVTRPFDTSSMGIPVPEEHQLESIERLFAFTGLVQKTAGPVPVVGNGYSWLRQFIPQAGAANLAAKRCSFVGLGRSSFAYPDLPLDVFKTGTAKKEKCCVTCSKCTQIMRDHGRTGCVIRDSEVYAPIYKEARRCAEERGQRHEASAPVQLYSVCP
jgi:2,4-dienoyl-CoA reductase-like NADH-dependent reductase (Old Yellow Enzyme family)